MEDNRWMLNSRCCTERGNIVQQMGDASGCGGPEAQAGRSTPLASKIEHTACLHHRLSPRELCQAATTHLSQDVTLPNLE